MKRAAGFNSERTYGIEIEFNLASNHQNLNLREVGFQVARLMNEAGVTCEFESYNHNVRSYWKIVTDASCGLELVSPPLKGDEGFRQIQVACNALHRAGAKVDRRCGLHVHHDAHDFTVNSFKALYGIYVRFEAAIDELMPMSRRGSSNHYCQSPRRSLTDIEACSQIRDITTRLYYDRYVKLNCQSYGRYGTVEFRQHSGTIEADKIVNWIVLTQAMVEKATKGTVVLKQGANDWFNFKKVIRAYAWMGADEKLQTAIKFYNERRIQLARQAGVETTTD